MLSPNNVTFHFSQFIFKITTHVSKKMDGGSINGEPTLTKCKLKKVDK